MNEPGWFLPYEAVKHLTSLPKLLAHATRARWTNAVVRKDGVETTYEADWIKHLRWVEACGAAAAPEPMQQLRAIWNELDLTRSTSRDPRVTDAPVPVPRAWFGRMAKAIEAISPAGVAVAPDNRISVDRGALQMALNVLCRAGKNEVADALAESADAGVPPSDGGQQ